MFVENFNPYPMTPKQVFEQVWLEHFGERGDLDIVLKHDYIFEAMIRYAREMNSSGEDYQDDSDSWSGGFADNH